MEKRKSYEVRIKVKKMKHDTLKEKTKRGKGEGND